jgi:hypothetical protein
VRQVGYLQEALLGVNLLADYLTVPAENYLELLFIAAICCSCL